MTEPVEEESTKPKRPTPPYKWAAYFGRGTPWAWVNLTPDEQDVLMEQLGVFVDDYNATLVTEELQIIPPCWPKHPPLVQILPPLFYGWWWTHRVVAHPPHGPDSPLGWHERHLWPFQQRVDAMLGPGGTACREGRHGQVRSVRAEDALLRLGADLTPRLSRTFGTDE